MSKFFQAIGIIFCLSLFILIYYYVKQLIIQRYNKANNIQIQKKYYRDKKEYLRSFLSVYVPYLIDNKIQWIMIQSKSSPFHKTQIIYSKLNEKIELIVREIENLKNHSDAITKLGVNQINWFENNIKIEIPPNSKILTDILYYIFEEILKIRQFKNFKIITSGNSLRI